MTTVYRLDLTTAEAQQLAVMVSIACAVCTGSKTAPGQGFLRAMEKKAPAARDRLNEKMTNLVHSLPDEYAAD